jgi:hypothetical protein
LSLLLDAPCLFCSVPLLCHHTKARSRSCYQTLFCRDALALLKLEFF